MTLNSIFSQLGFTTTHVVIIVAIVVGGFVLHVFLYNRKIKKTLYKNRDSEPKITFDVPDIEIGDYRENRKEVRDIRNKIKQVKETRNQPSGRYINQNIDESFVEMENEDDFDNGRFKYRERQHSSPIVEKILWFVLFLIPFLIIRAITQSTFISILLALIIAVISYVIYKKIKY
jgi:hypothetical protein